MEWNALTILRLYEVTGEETYLDTARKMWRSIYSAWNDNYGGGGIAWKKDRPWSKNACSNGPAAILGARLYRVTKDEEYLKAAQKIYA